MPILTKTKANRHRNGGRPDPRTRHIGAGPLPGRRSRPCNTSPQPATRPNSRTADTNFGPLNIEDVLHDGCWRGRPCFVIGGGPSLKSFDWDRLTGHLSIGVNRAFERMHHPSIIYSMDHLYYRNLEADSYGDGECGENVRQRFLDYNGVRLWIHTKDWYTAPDIYECGRLANSDRMSESIKDGLGGGNNSGFGALNLAIILGADPIYLLGFDMKGSAGQNDWWHKPHIRRNKNALVEHRASDGCYKLSFIPHFKKISSWANARAKIINLNPDSAIDCFRKEDGADKITPVDRPIVISFFTKGTGYETEVENLRNSVMRYGLEHEIVGIASRGNWLENCSYKPRFIREMLLKHPGRNLLWLDADARIQKYPELLDDWTEGDVALHLRQKRDAKGILGGEVLSGTILMRSNEKTLALVTRWRDRCIESPKEWDQRVLQHIIEREDLGKSDVGWPTIAGLPAEYCCISDTMMGEIDSDPVIVHYQASRRFRAEVNAQAAAAALAAVKAWHLSGKYQLYA